MQKTLSIFSRSICGALLATLVPGSAPPSQLTAPDVSGLWLFDVTTSLGTGAPFVSFDQNGSELRGRYSSLAWGDVDLFGQVDDLDIVFSFNTTDAAGSLSVIYTAVLTAPNRMEGILTIPPFDSGVFTAYRPDGN